MEIYNLPIFAWGGMFLGLMVLIQVLTGARVIKATPKLHQYLGWIIFVGGIVHGILALAYILK